MKRFPFNTGVRGPGFHRPEIPLMEGQIWQGGVKQIPFYCADVPEGATFKYASNDEDPLPPSHIRRQIYDSTLGSKYAVFCI